MNTAKCNLFVPVIISKEKYPDTFPNKTRSLPEEETQRGNRLTRRKTPRSK